VSLVLLGVSIVVMVVGTVLILRAVDVGGDDFDVPGAASVQLERGTYAVWLSDGSSFTSRFLRADITVTGPAGEPVTVRRPVGSSTLGSGNEQYSDGGEFEARTAGLYRVTVDSDDATLARVAPPLSPGQIVGGVISIVASVGLFLLGLLLLIIALVRRSKVGRPAAAQPAPYVPPGYGPPPGYGAPPGYGPPPGYPPTPGYPGGYAPAPGYPPGPAPGPAPSPGTPGPGGPPPDAPATGGSPAPGPWSPPGDEGS
jgi:hypothetical protein